MRIERPILPNNFDFVDPDCLYLAQEIYREVNETFAPVLGEEKIIKTYRTFNDNFMPLVDFPVMKVYKDREEEDSANSDLMITSFVISYALAYTQENRVSDISTFVSKEIRRVLKNLSIDGRLQLDWERPLTIDYEDFIDPQFVIYKYANIRFSMYTSASSICNCDICH